MNDSLPAALVQEARARYPNYDYIIYTDGASSGNPGPGGVAYVIVTADGKGLLEKKFYPSATNNQMELTAAILALQQTLPNTRIVLITDSQYLMKAFTDGWLAKWKRNGWKTSDGKSVKNQDLWICLDRIISQRQVDFGWVKGHGEDPINNLVDTVARQTAKGKL